MTEPQPPAVPMGPAMVAPFREVIHNINQFGEHWSWRCGVQWTRASEGWTSGACRYDHVVDSWDELVEQATAHLAKWHGVAPAGSVPDTGQARDDIRGWLHEQIKAGGDPMLARVLDALNEPSGDTVQPDLAYARSEVDKWLADNDPYCILPTRTEHIPALLARLDELEGTS